MGEGSGLGRVVQGCTGSYVFRRLVQDIPLSGEDNFEEAQISCAELCEDNLYIGTSQAEILHFVSLPADPTDELQAPQYIFASRLQPAYNVQATSSPQRLPGVQTILVLPKVQKACVLCNGTLSFYSLPELSPVFTTVANCTWVGGVNLSGSATEEENGVVVMICVKNRVRLVKLREEARRVRDIEFPGCLQSVRRGNFACVADVSSYALLDVENQQKISLFPISSLDENSDGGKVEKISSNLDVQSTRNRSSSRPISSEGELEGKSHGRSTSLGALVGGLGRRQASPQPKNLDRSSIATPEPLGKEISLTLASSHSRNVSTPEVPIPMPMTNEKPLPLPPPKSDSLTALPPARRGVSTLAPHISSPTPNEFLLATGTGAQDPGVGIFVNLDGDVVRGTLQFEQYPRTIVLDGEGVDEESTLLDEGREGYVLACMSKPGEKGEGDERGVVEIQRWDIENRGQKEWLEIPNSSLKSSNSGSPVAHVTGGFGIRAVETTVTVPFPEVGELLRGSRLRMSSQAVEGCSKALEDWEKKRNEEELAFGRRLGGRDGHIIVWSGDCIWWVVRTPIAVKLNAAVDGVLEKVPKGESYTEMERNSIIQIINDTRGLEATSETEFLSLELIRQKVGLVLFADLIARPLSLPHVQLHDSRTTENLLMEGGLDPRVILGLIPLLREEVIEGQHGIWIHAGLSPVIERYTSTIRKSFAELQTNDLPTLLKRYLSSWRQRKGFGSIADEIEIFQTVDAALLRILLEQDTRESSYTNKPSSTRIELNSLVSSGIDCFERAVSLLEQYKRLYVLSRLYQSRKMFRKVLETWKRIIEGEKDEGGGLLDGENEVRKYLANIRDTGLVDEFGTWLARRNPALGVQVFTNDSGRVKWEPRQVVMLLRRKAPDAVKAYLEHLVFGKKNVQYANELISYYLDSVLTVLESSDDARAILSQSYESYRALQPPKPTYRQFIVENAVPLPWWHDRIRLLELIGGSHGSDFSYDVTKILTRIEPFEEELVPESIILDGRQGRHQQALRLLTHGLGDYHTAVNYCLLGGASIFHPTSGSAGAIAAPSQEEQAFLFGHLLIEFLRIEDLGDRLERTSELLERFGSWYDIQDVLNLIPEAWSVKLISGFLISSFRRLVHEGKEATMTKALSGAENLQVASAFVEKCSDLGPRIETHSSEQENLT